MKESYYLPLLEFKSLIKSSEKVAEVVKWKYEEPIHQKLFSLMNETPPLNLQFKKEEDTEYQYKLPYIDTKGVVTKSLDTANNFIRINYEDWEKVVLSPPKVPNNLSYSALVSTLKFEFFMPANSCNYAIKDRKVKGYTFSNQEYLYNDKYEGVCVNCTEGDMYILQGKKHTLKIDSYESFLDVVIELFQGEGLDTEGNYGLLFPHIDLKLSPPEDIMKGIVGLTATRINNIEFTRSKIHSNITLDKYGMTVKTGAIAEFLSRGLSRNVFKVDDNFFIFLTDVEGALVNALYVDKSDFQFID